MILKYNTNFLEFKIKKISAEQAGIKLELGQNKIEKLIKLASSKKAS